MSHTDDYREMIQQHRDRARKATLKKQRGTRPADTLRAEALGFARSACCRLEEDPGPLVVELALEDIRKVEYRLKQLRAGHRLRDLNERSRA